MTQGPDNVSNLNLTQFKASNLPAACRSLAHVMIIPAFYMYVPLDSRLPIAWVWVFSLHVLHVYLAEPPKWLVNIVPFILQPWANFWLIPLLYDVMTFLCRRFLQDTKNVSSFHKSPDSSAFEPFDFKEMFYIPVCCDVKLNLS